MVEKGVAIAKMTAATLLGEDPNIAAMTAATLLGEDPNIAAMTAGNAARHNAFQFIIPTFFIGLSAWDVYQAYKKGGFEAGLKQVGVEVAISVAGGKAAKAGIEVGKNFIRLAKSLSLSSKPLVRGKPMLSRAPICKS